MTIDALLHRPNDKLTCIYSTDPPRSAPRCPIEARNGLAVSSPVPATGFVIYR